MWCHVTCRQLVCVKTNLVAVPLCWGLLQLFGTPLTLKLVKE